MGFRAKGAKRNPRRYQSFANIGNAFDCFYRYWLIFTLKIHQVSEVYRPLPGHHSGIFFPALIGASITGMLHGMNDLPVKGHHQAVE